MLREGEGEMWVVFLCHMTILSHGSPAGRSENG